LVKLVLTSSYTKGLYQTGDVVILHQICFNRWYKSAFEQYLAGPEHDRVKSIRLRGEISCGIILPRHLVPDFESYEFDEDISELGLSKYEPPIPTQLAGKVSVFEMPLLDHDWTRKCIC
jgi:RNA ligase (TIGR02306 family)